MDIQNIQNLENTVDLMLSDNHIDRLKAEYIQTYWHIWRLLREKVIFILLWQSLVYSVSPKL